MKYNTGNISGFADEICASLDGQIEVIKKLGISQIEMRGVNGRPLVEHTLEEVKVIKEQLDREGITISAVGSPLGKISITDPFEPHYELFQKTVEIAKILNTNYIRMFSFYIPKGETAEAYEKEVFERLGRFVAYAKEQNVVLLHENEKGIYGDTASHCAKLMEQFYGDHFKAVFDFANFVQVGQNTLEAYEQMKPYIHYIHVKDALMDTEEVVPAGQGDGHVEEILRKLFADGFDGVLSLEPHLTLFDGFAKLEIDGVLVERHLTGEEAYTIACQALKKILERIEKN